MKNKVKQQNQLHPPQKDSVDEMGNKRVGAYFKSGNATILIARGLTPNGVKVLGNAIENMCKDLHVELEGTIISAPVKLKKNGSSKKGTNSNNP